MGNDFDEPDRIYLNDHGKLRPVKAKDSPLPFSGMTTMSFDTGDLDNDGRHELYIAQIAMGKMGELPKRLAPPVSSCGLYTDMADISRCTALARFQAAVDRGRDTWTIGLCKELSDPAEQRDCAVMAYHWSRILLRLPASGADKAAVLAECAKIPADYTALHDVCTAMAASPMDYNQSHKTLTDEIPSVAHHNILFASDGKSWADATDRWKTGYGGWSWNAKFADLDNDGWQDLFIAQGTRLRLYNPSNVLYLQPRRRAAGGGHPDGGTGGPPAHRGLALPRLRPGWRPGRGDLSRSSSPRWCGATTPRRAGASRSDWTIAARPIATESEPGWRSAPPTVGSRSGTSRPAAGTSRTTCWSARFGLGDWKQVASIEVTWPDGESTELHADALGPPDRGDAAGFGSAGAIGLSPGRYRVVRRANRGPGCRTPQ